jgi:hypothetical protein
MMGAKPVKSKQTVAIGFAVYSTISWFAPEFSGVMFDDAAVSAGEGRIISAILLVGAAILWFMPER